MRRIPSVLLLGLCQIIFAAKAIDKFDGGVSIPGDITLGGLFPVTSDENCVTINSAPRGIQRMEAMIFSLMEVNSDRSLLRYGRHKINLGGRLFDTCGNRDTALRRALLFLADRTNSNGGGDPLTAAPYVCPTVNGTQQPAIRMLRSTDTSSGPIRGVVGPAYSSVSMSVVRLLGLFNVPVISYASTASQLSDRDRAPLFARTVASDEEQANILADIVKHFKIWNFVSIVFSSGAYSEGLMLAFESKVAKFNVCIGERLRVDDERSVEEFDRVVNRLVSQSRARVVVLILQSMHIRPFLKAVKRAGVRQDRFVWIACYAWGNRISEIEGYSEIASGLITVQMESAKLPRFENYFYSLRPGSSRVFRRPDGADAGRTFTNQYFDRFWKQYFRCNLDDEDKFETSEERPACDASMSLSQDGFFINESLKEKFVSDAVYTYAHALDKIMKLVCTAQDSESDTKATGEFDDCVRNITDLPGPDLYKVLISKNNSFLNSAGQLVEFTAAGDGLPTFTILNYRMNATTGRYAYEPIGEWHKNSGLNLKADGIAWPGGAAAPPSSTCSDACRPGQRKILSWPQSCCWVCVAD